MVLAGPRSNKVDKVHRNLPVIKKEAGKERPGRRNGPGNLLQRPLLPEHV